jgi:hypothetical protein
MERLNVRDPLFNRLSRENENLPKWWKALISDDDIIIQIRKDNSIDAYFNGGTVITGLKFCNGEFSGRIHIKYIPIIKSKQKESHERNGGSEEIEDDKAGYIKYSFGGDSIEFGQIQPIKLENFSTTKLRRIKDRVLKYYLNDSEKGIQYAFIKDDPSFIDSEFQYRHDNKTIRIDLVRVDIKKKQLVFIEVKRMMDTRLDNDEIIVQLESYRNFIRCRKESLLEYYKKVIQIKAKLGLELPESLLAEDFQREYKITEKPLLLLGDCTTSWIKKFSDKLDKKIEDYAIGCYYFGSPNRCCDILDASMKNRHIFKPCNL